MNLSSPARWHLITGEYPPDTGGVSDYTRCLARELAARGNIADVWTGAGVSSTSLEPDADVTVHRVAGRWKSADLRHLGRELDAFPAPRLLLIQYAPNAFKGRGMNLDFCNWLRHRSRRGDDVRIIFHEVRYLERAGDPLRRRFLARVQRLMIRKLLQAASTVYVTIPYWDHLLRPYAPSKAYQSQWLPVPSNIPTVADPAGVAALRAQLLPDGGVLIGNFGTFHDVIGEMVASVLPPLLLGHPDRVGIVLGRGGEPFAAALRARHPELDRRLIATGGIDGEDVARHLQACDLVVQPYPDGVCTKRSSAMAALANGAAVATTLGPISEPFWGSSNAVALAPDHDLVQLVRVSDDLLANPDERQRLGRAGRELYEREFSLAHMIERLTGEDRRPS